jgi:Ca2+-binding EF-hand superfamily protein
LWVLREKVFNTFVKMSRRNYGRVKSRIAQGHQVESKKSKEKKWKRKSLIKMKMRDEEMKSDGASQGSSYKVEPNVKEAVRQFLHALEQRKSLYGHNIDVNDLTSVFLAFDRDGEGTLDAAEFEEGLKRLGANIPLAHLNAIYATLGQDRSQDIQYSKFAKLVQTVKAEIDAEVTLRSDYRGVFAGERSSGRKWQVLFTPPPALSFGLAKPKPMFVGHFDDEVAAAMAYDRTVVERLGPIDGADYVNFRESVTRDWTTEENLKMERERDRRRKAIERSKGAVLFAVGKAIASNRTLYGHTLNNVREMFTTIDADGSGSIDASELGEALERLGLNLSKKQISDLVNLMDIDQNGCIDFEEFATAMRQGKREYADSLKRLRGTSVQSLLKKKKRLLKSPATRTERLNGWNNSTRVPLDVEWSELALPLSNLVQSDGTIIRPNSKNQPSSPLDATAKARTTPRPPSSRRKQSSLKSNRRRPQTSPNLSRRNQSPAMVPVSPMSGSRTRPSSPEWNHRFSARDVTDPGFVTGDETLLLSLSPSLQQNMIPGHGALENPRDLADKRQFRESLAFHMMTDLKRSKDEETGWDDRAVLTASSHNRGRHPSYRQYFDRPILLDECGNLQLHHRHLAVRIDKEALRKLTPDKAVLSFRGISISEKDKPGLYEVRIENALGQDAAANNGEVEEGGASLSQSHASLSSSVRFSQEEKDLVRVEGVIRMFLNAVNRTRKRKHSGSINDLRSIFDWIDEDGSGRMTKDALWLAFKEKGMTMTNTQINDVANALSEASEGDDIEFDCFLNQLREKRNFNKNLKESRRATSPVSSAMSHIVKSKKKQEEEWRQKRLEASNKIRSSELVEERQKLKAKKQLELETYIDSTTHVAYTNDPLKAAQLYDAALVRKFGHIASIPFMNFPESCPDLWPAFQRVILEQRQSPYLKRNLTVPEPGEKLEDPASFFETLKKASVSRRKKYVEKSQAKISSLSSLIGPSPSSPQGKKFGTNARVNKERPLNLKRYKNSNGVYVYYVQKEKRAKHKRKTPQKGPAAKKDASEYNAAERAHMDKVLDLVTDSIKKRRSVFGHKMTSVFDAFAAFDISNSGRLSHHHFRSAMERLGLGVSHKVLGDLIDIVDDDGNGTIEYEEFVNALDKRASRRERERELMQKETGPKFN